MKTLLPRLIFLRCCFRTIVLSYLDINSINSFLIASASNLLEPIWNAGERFLLAPFFLHSTSSLSLQSQSELPTSPITKMNLFITSLFPIYLIESNDLKSITIFSFLFVVLRFGFSFSLLVARFQSEMSK
jgi:hypothetical protein